MIKSTTGERSIYIELGESSQKKKLVNLKMLTENRPWKQCLEIYCRFSRGTHSQALQMASQGGAGHSKGLQSLRAGILGQKQTLERPVLSFTLWYGYTFCWKSSPLGIS